MGVETAPPRKVADRCARTATKTTDEPRGHALSLRGWGLGHTTDDRVAQGRRGVAAQADCNLVSLESLSGPPADIQVLCAGRNRSRACPRSPVHLASGNHIYHKNGGLVCGCVSERRLRA